MNETGNRSWGRMKAFVAILALAFAITLAVVIGNRLSEQALAVLMGAACGVGASIPTSLLIVAVTRRRERERGLSSHTVPGAYPPVVVVTPPNTPQRTSDWGYLPPMTPPAGPRQFTVVGGASVDTEVTTYEPYA